MASTSVSPKFKLQQWKAGGVEARPPTSVKAGDSIFHRLNPDGTVSDINGHKYAWAANLAHLDDTEVVVEDLSDIDIGSHANAKYEHILPPLLYSPAGILSDTFVDTEDIEIEGKKEYTTETFACLGLQVERRTYWNLDVRSGEPRHFATGPIARHFESDQKDYFDEEPPSKAVIQLVMAEILEERDGEMRGRKREMWQFLAAKAHGRWYRARNSPADKIRYREQLAGKVPLTPERQEHLKRVKENYKDITNRHHLLQIDRASAGVCDRITGKDVVVLRDKNWQLITGVLSRATQKLFPATTLAKMDRSIKSFAWRYPLSNVNETRHGTSYDDHLVLKPEKDLRHSKDPHHAVCSTDHYGVHHATGFSGLANLHVQNFAQGTYTSAIGNHPAWTEEFPKLREGVYGLCEKECRLSLKAWDPSLYNELLEIRQLLPPSKRISLATTGENPYQYVAQLVDAQTEGHTDFTDLAGGLAAIKCFGDFTEGDLVLKELGVRIEYPSGSHCHLRGRELHHFIMPYEGTRHCIVLTAKESVRKAARDMKDRMEELRGTARVFLETGLDRLTAEEMELVEASDSADDLAEFIYGWERDTLEINRDNKKKRKVEGEASESSKQQRT